jgi:hypothetical protein
MHTFVYPLPHRCLKFSTASLFVLALGASASAATLSVGPGRQFAAPCAAFNAAAAGDTVEIDAAGTYRADACTIPSGKDNLTIRGVNGRPKIDGAGMAGSDIWQVSSNGALIENVEMFGATNGIAIALSRDTLNLTVRGSYLHDNAWGIFAKLNLSNGESTVTIANSAFERSGVSAAEGHQLQFLGNYAHDMNGNGLLSEATSNLILENRYSGSGQSGYPISLASRGPAYIVGNFIQQPTYNAVMLDFGAPAFPNPIENHLYVINNTFLNDDSSGGTFIRVNSDILTPALVQNNLFVGTGTAITQTNAIDQSNYKTLDTRLFVDRPNYDLHPAVGSAVINAGSPTALSASRLDLTPLVQYKHVGGKEVRPFTGALTIGAYEPIVAAPTPPVISMLDDSKWTPCAREDGSCLFTGTRRVRYGADSIYAIQSATAMMDCNNASFGDPRFNVVKSCWYENTPIDMAAETATTAWAPCANEGSACTFSGAHQVRYGANGIFVYKSATDTVDCSNEVFGDPLFNVIKHCEYDVLAVKPDTLDALPLPVSIDPFADASPPSTPAPTPSTLTVLPAILGTLPITVTPTTTTTPSPQPTVTNAPTVSPANANLSTLLATSPAAAAAAFRTLLATTPATTNTPTIIPTTPTTAPAPNTGSFFNVNLNFLCSIFKTACP